MPLLEELYKKSVEAFPNIIFALIIAIIGWILAKVIARIVRKVLEALQVDRLADKLNEIDIVSKANFTILPSQVLSKLVYYLILLVSFIAATDYLGIEAVSNLMSDLINYIPSLLSAVVFFIIGLLVADFIRGIVLTTCQSLSIPSAKVISSIVFYFDMMSNFLASFYVKNKFEAGDRITVDGIQGQIETMDNKSFVLKTADSKIVFPLNKLAQDKVEIHS